MGLARAMQERSVLLARARRAEATPLHRKLASFSAFSSGDEFAVEEEDLAGGAFGEAGVVGDHDQGAALLVQ